MDWIRAAFALASFAQTPDGWQWLEKRLRGRLVLTSPGQAGPLSSSQSPYARAHFPPRADPSPQEGSRELGAGTGGFPSQLWDPSPCPQPARESLTSLWPEASGQSRNPRAHGQLAAGRASQTPRRRRRQTDHLFHLRPRAAKDRVPAELVQSQGSLL